MDKYGWIDILGFCDGTSNGIELGFTDSNGITNVLGIHDSI